jgi:anti-sigma28 factor (negative regulator of flagellin synthesis)
MRISNEHISRLIGARVERVFGPGKQTPADGVIGTSADGAVFSTRSEDVRAGMAAARAATSSDEARLAALQAQVRSGQYRPPAEAVAESVLRDLGK